MKDKFVNIVIDKNEGSRFLVSEDNSIDTVNLSNDKQISIARINIKDSKGNNKTSGSFVTGDVVVIGNSKEEESFGIVIYGDVNGDGKIDKDDSFEYFCLNLMMNKG